MLLEMESWEGGIQGSGWPWCWVTLGRSSASVLESCQSQSGHSNNALATEVVVYWQGRYSHQE